MKQIIQYSVATLFISISAGISLIVYPVFLQLYFPNRTLNNLHYVAVCLISYEIGRYLNYILSPIVLNKIKLKTYVWTILIISLIFNILFGFTSNLYEISLIRFALGLFTTHNNLSNILNTLMNLKKNKALHVYTQISPNIIFIINFLFGLFLFDYDGFKENLLNNRDNQEISLIQNLTKFPKEINIPHFNVAIFICVEYMILMVILGLSNTISFEDSSFISSEIPSDKITPVPKKSFEMSQEENKNDFSKGNSKATKTKRELILFSDPNTPKDKRPKLNNKTIEHNKSKEIVKFEIEENQQQKESNSEGNLPQSLQNKETKDISTTNIKKVEVNNTNQYSDRDISKNNIKKLEIEEKSLNDINNNYIVSKKTTTKERSNLKLNLNIEEAKPPKNYIVKKHFPSSQTNELVVSNNTFEKQLKAIITQPGNSLNEEDSFNNKNEYSFLKFTLILTMITFSNAIIFNIMLIILYFEFCVKFNSDSNNKELLYSFTIIYLAITIVTYLKLKLLKENSTFSFKNFVVFTIINTICSILIIVWLFTFKDLITDNIVILVFCYFVFATQSIFSQFTINEFWKAVSSYSLALQAKLNKKHYLFTIPSRCLAILLVYIINNNYIQDDIQISKEYNTYVIMVSSVLVFLNIFIIRNIN